MRAAGSSGFVPAAPGACGEDRTTVGLSGVVKAMSGFVSFFSAMATVMLDCDWVRVPSGAIDCKDRPRASPAGRAAARRRRGRRRRSRPGMALAVPKQLDGRARGRPSGDHALAASARPERRRTRARPAPRGRRRPAARPKAGPGAAAGADGSARRVSAGGAVAAGAGCAGWASGVLEPAPRPALVSPPGGLRRGSGARGRIPNQITTAASAAKPDAATAVRPSREMAILIHTLSAALFGSLRRLCSKRPWRSGRRQCATTKPACPALPGIDERPAQHLRLLRLRARRRPGLRRDRRRRSAASSPRPASGSSMAAAMSASWARSPAPCWRTAAM